ncbi:hypothetical protein M0638_07225 [Roseomonas sp. NAR14]|uniref:Uncharacterized protein n=1 Tax=Roseomonas acroporae TaxID=2937791 RepID=A0A9X2BUJ7_9PROT|nr:hypothetical protein [Roseomonas acroporae]MCK8784166.1 hypothetical protein [Roseomonas acroporae]
METSPACPVATTIVDRFLALVRRGVAPEDALADATDYLLALRLPCCGVADPPAARATVAAAVARRAARRPPLDLLIDLATPALPADFDGVPERRRFADPPSFRPGHRAGGDPAAGPGRGPG